MLTAIERISNFIIKNRTITYVFFEFIALNFVKKYIVFVLPKMFAEIFGLYLQYNFELMQYGSMVVWQYFSIFIFLGGCGGGDCVPCKIFGIRINFMTIILKRNVIQTSIFFKINQSNLCINTATYHQWDTNGRSVYS